MYIYRNRVAVHRALLKTLGFYHFKNLARPNQLTYERAVLWCSKFHCKTTAWHVDRCGYGAC